MSAFLRFILVLGSSLPLILVNKPALACEPPMFTWYYFQYELAEEQLPPTITFQSTEASDLGGFHFENEGERSFFLFLNQTTDSDIALTAAATSDQGDWFRTLRQAVDGQTSWEVRGGDGLIAIPDYGEYGFLRYNFSRWADLGGKRLDNIERPQPLTTTLLLINEETAVTLPITQTVAINPSYPDQVWDSCPDFEESIPIEDNQPASNSASSQSAGELGNQTSDSNLFPWLAAALIIVTATTLLIWSIRQRRQPPSP